MGALASSLFSKYRAQIVERVAAARLPTIYQWPEMAEEGGLMAYGPRFVTLYRQQALQVTKVLKGSTWKTKGTISLGGADSPIATESFLRGLDHFRQKFQGEFGGMKVEGVAVLAGDKGWRKFGDDANRNAVFRIGSGEAVLHKNIASLQVVERTLEKVVELRLLERAIDLPPPNMIISVRSPPCAPPPWP